MMKQQRSATNLSPSKLCRWLLLAAFTKIAVLVFMFTDVVPNLLRERPMLPEVSSEMRVADTTLTDAPEQQTGNVNKILKVNADGVVVASSGNAAGLVGVSTAKAQDNVSAPDDSLSREAMQQRQDDLARKEQELRTLEKSLDTKLEDLRVLEGKIQSMLKEADTLKDSKYRHLVDVYSNMKAKQAAQVLETLDEKIAVKILAGMKGRQAGEVLGFVVPAKAARLSESLTKMQMSFN